LKTKPHFFEETELEPKPTFWPPFSSVFGDRVMAGKSAPVND